MQNTIMIAASYTLTLSQILHVHGKAMQLHRQSIDLHKKANALKRKAISSCWKYMELHITAMASHRTAMHLYGKYIHLNWEAVGKTSSAYVKQIMYSSDAATTWKYVESVRGRGRGLCPPPPFFWSTCWKGLITPRGLLIQAGCLLDYPSQAFVFCSKSLDFT